MPRFSRQTIAPDPFTKEELARDNWKELVVKLSSPGTVLRYLLSKVVYTDKEITQAEIVTLFCAWEQIVIKVQKDPSTKLKYGYETFLFRSIFQSLDQLVKMKPKERFELLQKQYGFYRGKLVSRRYYYALEGQCKKLYETYIRQRFPKSFKPKAFIGKGYGDHGTAKNKAYDGSPSWQETALDERHRGSESGVNSLDYFRQYQVHELQLFRCNTKLRRNVSKNTSSASI